ncbi:hemolysin-type calcium-binding region [Nostoc commune NIES-4072]|uniref:Hemolysin-type calcium-binding region n=1 Tax=Nostoc commune NIES-4072 TaxID=2005467 RepID=A0A2R5FVI4_NOSCO|nr:calcium-binding protein [Nostoc commune]BBD66713.1 hemolysin-type calcium-binding region [Nostoc commune HK-02]GBG22305.1 hemolysin-type calcium-binding region [Nostoc commune NIES-4072]
MANIIETKGKLFVGGDGNDNFSIGGYQYDPDAFGFRPYTSSANNTLNGGAGDDDLSVQGSEGDNLLNGDAGDDTLDTSYLLVGDSGPYLIPSEGNNTLNGGAGDDRLYANSSSGNNLLNGDDGNDSLFSYGFFQIEQGRYYDIVPGNNTLNGGAGNDRLDIDYSTGNNLLSGGDGKDTLDIGYSTGNNLLSGGDDNDSLSASGGYGYNGGLPEVYREASGNNTLDGGAGNDTLSIDNSTGNNVLSGGDGNDSLSASAALGNNTLNGGTGNDTLIGGSGTDTFVFNSFNEGIDSLYGFNATNELIQVSAAGFDCRLSIGSLKASQFTIGTSATTCAQRFIYDFTTGALYFDRDGSGGSFTQIQFAQLFGGVSLTENNFVVV